jgi:DNA-binding NarL/FixJ family response regulator
MEAQIAQFLVKGACIRHIADECGLTLNTARWYLKQIVQKVGANSQAELLRLLLRGPVAVFPPT